MTTLREAAQQALEALEGKRYTACGWRSDCDKAITALRAALAEPTVPSDCPDSHQPVAWYHVPYPGSGISPVVSMFQQREPSLYGAVVPLYTALQRCPNCASLQDQNTELDRKLADLEQTSLELCETCGWRTLIPAEGCLNCARSKPLTIERLRDALVASRIIPPAAVEDPDEYDDGVTLFRIEALHRRIT